MGARAGASHVGSGTRRVGGADVLGIFGGAGGWTFAMNVVSAWRATPGGSLHPQAGGTETLLFLVKKDARRVRDGGDATAGITDADRKLFAEAQARSSR